MHIAKPFLVLALGVPLVLAGCATRSSVELAQNSANAADAHAASADGHAMTAVQHAADARSQADQATSIGNNAMTAAQTADGKATSVQAGLLKANQRIAYLENKLLPHHKHKVRHKTHKSSGTPQQQS